MYNIRATILCGNRLPIKLRTNNNLRANSILLSTRRLHFDICSLYIDSDPPGIRHIDLQYIIGTVAHTNPN